MEWERKFYDIVRETESNLSNARRKLQGSSTPRPFSSSYDYLTPSKGLSVPFYKPVLPTPMPSDNDQINSLRRQLGYNLPSTSTPRPPHAASTSLASVETLHIRQLQAQVDSQSSTIEKLERLVKSLNQEKEQYRTQIRDLQSEVLSVSSLVTAANSSPATVNNLSRSLKNMECSVHSELDNLRRNVSLMTQRVGRLEFDSSATQRNLEDQLRLNSLNASTASRLSQSNAYASTPGSNFQVTELRSTIADFHNKLDRLEARIAASKANPITETSVYSSALGKSLGRTTKSSKPKSKSSKVDKFLIDMDLVDDDLGDLDLSDDLDLESEASEDLSNDLEELLGNVRPSKIKSTSFAKEEDPFSVPDTDDETADSDPEDLASDLDINLNNFDLGSAASDLGGDLYSLEDTSLDLELKMDDL